MAPYLLEPKPAICFPFTSCHFLLRSWLLRLTLLPGQETITQEMERCGSVGACRGVLGMTLNPQHLSVTCIPPAWIPLVYLQLDCSFGAHSHCTICATCTHILGVHQHVQAEWGRKCLLLPVLKNRFTLKYWKGFRALLILQNCGV